jgi:hypothetical protein
VKTDAQTPGSVAREFPKAFQAERPIPGYSWFNPEIYHIQNDIADNFYCALGSDMEHYGAASYVLATSKPPMEIPSYAYS